MDRTGSPCPPVLRVAAIRELERRHASLPLMERAGSAAAEDAAALLERRTGVVVVLAGPGNNGGDAFVVAHSLARAFHPVVVVFRGDPAKLPPDAASAYARLRDAGLETVASPPAVPPALVVDGLFGIGLARPLAAEYAALVEWANRCGAPILALDVPTGLDADTGRAREPAIRATATSTFLAWKPGLLTGDGPDLAGRTALHDLGVRDDAAEGRRLEWRDVARSLPDVLHRRQRSAHKGTFGTLTIVGGAQGMVGAALLASRAALRCGAGKVRVGFLATSMPGFDPIAPETMLGDADSALASPCNALVVGCGLGTGDDARRMLLSAIAQPVPLAIDADGLNVLAGDDALAAALAARDAPTLLTPHPAEAARLARTDVASIERDRLGAALALAGTHRAHVVLKGAGSVLAHPDGTFDVNASGNPALASGGTGDVLAGMLGALLAQRVDAADALRIAVCLHGAAADALVARGIGPLGVAASELPDAARDLLNAATRAA